MIDGEPGAGGLSSIYEKLEPARLDCTCDCSILKVEDIDQDTVMIGLYISTWQMYVRSPWYLLMRRFKIAWQILCGKEYLAHDMMIRRDDFSQFVKELQKWQ